jgi:hypothetical protein
MAPSKTGRQLGGRQVSAVALDYGGYAVSFPAPQLPPRMAAFPICSALSRQDAGGFSRRAS